jgi:flagellin
MTSILTNNSAMAALSTLRSISSSMEDTQSRISSGLRVGSASDNAAYWSIATTMRSDNMALSAVQDALGLGAAKADTAYSGMESAIEVVKEIKAKLVAAREPGVDKTKIQSEIDQLQEQLTSIAESASFSGENWLQADINDGSGGAVDVTKQIVGSFTRDANGNVSVKTISYTLSTSTVLFDTDPTATAAQKRGILDQHHTITTGPSIEVSVNIDGNVDQYDVAAYSMDDILADQAAGAVLTWDGDAVQSDGNGTLAAGFYVKLDNGTWVKANQSTTSDTGGQEAVYHNSTSGNYYTIDTANAPGSTTVTYSVSDLTITTGTTNTQLDEMIQVVDKALEDMTTAAAELGSINTRIDLQQEFVSKLSDALDSGIGRLVDADMNEESTRLKALQTQQQLAIQALSIANSDSQNVLSLFR